MRFAPRHRRLDGAELRTGRATPRPATPGHRLRAGDRAPRPASRSSADGTTLRSTPLPPYPVLPPIRLNLPPAALPTTSMGGRCSAMALKQERWWPWCRAAIAVSRTTRGHGAEPDGWSTSHGGTAPGARLARDLLLAASYTYSRTRDNWLARLRRRGRYLSPDLDQTDDWSKATRLTCPIAARYSRRGRRLSAWR
jgi:hypothetical protein